jgi:hypothetical protein
MDGKLEWDVDVEGIVDMIVVKKREMGASMSSSRGQWTLDITCPFVEKVLSCINSFGALSF